ncbi:MAG TPA: type II secretion system F family protein [Phycisphaerales bacterium]|nr:type II secretion system F family protein [Phycisphaerales bacterium]HIB01916.1 type II secretion system F family protein [Phycisphaerales bacterium]HIO52997.1 type II secretion system F family protein [Phycisphaerales bacterium]
MPTYIYEALNAAGKPEKGRIEADSSDAAIAAVRLNGFFPTSVREEKIKGASKADKVKTETKKKAKKKGGGINFSIGGVKTKILTQFTRQLSTLQDAGLPLLRSLQILEQQQKPGKLKTIIGEVVEDVESGTSLSDAMGKHPKAFDRLYAKMVAAGEIGGVLDVILQRLANFMEKAERLKSRVKGAMIYPICVIVVAVGIVTGIMYFVIPKFKDIFDDFDVTLPGLTLWLIDASLWIAGTPEQGDQAIPGFVWIMASPFIIFFFFKLIRKTGPGRASTDIILMKIPVLGNLVEKTSVARFTRTLGTLIAAGVPILEAVLITRDTSGNHVYEKALTGVHDSIREGESVAAPLREAKVCDSIVVNMIEVGEETGDLDVMLMKIADNYDEEVDVAVTALLSLLEPMLVVVLGGIVGTIVLALFLPLVKMIESVSDAG